MSAAPRPAANCRGSVRFVILIAALSLPTRARAADAIVPDEFPTIGLAVASAFDRDADGSVVIRVRPGEYRENVLIARSNLSIEGDDRDTTIVRGNGLAPTIQISNALRVTLEALTVRGGGATADGIALLRSAGCEIRGCLVVDNRRGIALERSPGNTILACEARANATTGIRIGRESDGTIVRANLAVLNRKNGIDVVSSDGVAVLENDSSLNSDNGIRVAVSSYCQVIHNRCSGNSENGILSGRATDVLVLSNTCTGNDDNGIRLIETHRYTVSDNVFTDNHGYGIRRRDWDADDFDAGAPGPQPPPSANDVSGNDDGGLREDF